MILLFAYLFLLQKCLTIGIIKYKVTTINLTNGAIDFGANWCSSYSYNSTTNTYIFEIKDLNGNKT